MKKDVVLKEIIMMLVAMALSGLMVLCSIASSNEHVSLFNFITLAFVIRIFISMK